jgi:hypothetical protein
VVKFQLKYDHYLHRVALILAILSEMSLPRTLGEWKWPLVVAAASLAISGLERAWSAYKQRRSGTWPISYGHITKTAVHQSEYESILTLEYSYPVPDEPYPIPGEFLKQFSLPEQAWAWAEALRDKNIPVRFSPSNAWKSVLVDFDLETVANASPPLPPADENVR